MAKKTDVPPADPVPPVTDTPAVAAVDVPPAPVDVPPEAPPTPVVTQYEVGLLHLPTVVVDADSPEAAWQVYMKLQNITASIHTPKIKPILPAEQAAG
jgi:hypothetical protein